MHAEQISPIRAEWRSRRVRLRDGTTGGEVVAILGSMAFAIGLAVVVGWQWFPGHTDSIRGLDGRVELPRSAVVTVGLMIAAAAALLTWHAVGARTVRPGAALAGVGLGGLMVCLVAFAWADRLAMVAANTPSLSEASRHLADRLVMAGRFGVACAVAVPALGRLRHRTIRWVVTMAAAAPWLTVTSVYLFASDGAVVHYLGTVPARDGHGLMVVVAREPTKWMTETAVPLAALVAVAAVALVAVLGVREFAEQKVATSSRLVRVGIPASARVVMLLGALIIVLFGLGRLDLLPGGRDSLPALSKVGIESWILAGAFAVIVIRVLARVEHRPVAHRGAFVAILTVGVALTSGHFLFAAGRALQVIGSPFTDSLWWSGQMLQTITGWSAWCLVWATLLVPCGAGLVGFWLRRRGERSDRTMFLLSVAVIGALPGVQTVLEHRGVDWFGTDIGAATADQVMLLVAIIATAAAVLGRALLPVERVIRVQVLVLLATFVAALLGSATSNRFFQLGLVVPLVAGLLRSGEDSKGRPARGAFALASGIVLLVLFFAGLVNGFVGAGTSGMTEQYVFLVMSGPLLLIAVAPRAEVSSASTAASESTGPRPLVAWALPALACVVLAVGAVAATKVTPREESARRFRVDVKVQPGWLASQEALVDGESVWLERGSTVVEAKSVAGERLRCSGGVDKLAVPGDAGIDAGFVGNLAARRYERAGGSGGFVTCAEQVSPEGTSYLLVVHTQMLDESALAQLSAITFAVG